MSSTFLNLLSRSLIKIFIHLNPFTQAPTAPREPAVFPTHPYGSVFLQALSLSTTSQTPAEKKTCPHGPPLSSTITTHLARPIHPYRLPHNHHRPPSLPPGNRFPPRTLLQRNNLHHHRLRILNLLPPPHRTNVPHLRHLHFFLPQQRHDYRRIAVFDANANVCGHRLGRGRWDGDGV